MWTRGQEASANQEPQVDPAHGSFREPFRGKEEVVGAMPEIRGDFQPKLFTFTFTFPADLALFVEGPKQEVVIEQNLVSHPLEGTQGGLAYGVPETLLALRHGSTRQDRSPDVQTLGDDGSGGPGP
jgi:hypothetical protein